MWEKESVLYNNYYQRFEDFRDAVIGFLDCISKLNIESEFWKNSQEG